MFQFSLNNKISDNKNSAYSVNFWVIFKIMLVATDLDTFHKSLDSYLSQPGLFDKMCRQRKTYNPVLYLHSLNSWVI